MKLIAIKRDDSLTSLRKVVEQKILASKEDWVEVVLPPEDRAGLYMELISNLQADGFTVLYIPCIDKVSIIVRWEGCDLVQVG